MSKKLLAGLLALFMLLSLVPVAALAAENDDAADNEALHLAKSAQLQADGTYQITLEAYATGTVTSTEKTTPCDIVLLLDVSGSMNNNMGGEKGYLEANLSVAWAYGLQNDRTYYIKSGDDYHAVKIDRTGDWRDYRYTVTDTVTGKEVYKGKDTSSIKFYYDGNVPTKKLEMLKKAVEAFVKATAEKNEAISDASQKHRIALVKFAAEVKDSTGNDTDSNGWNYSQIVQELTSDENALKTSLNGLTAEGPTAADYGMNRAAAALGDLSKNDGRKKIVIMFTDGEPNHSNGFSDTVANDAVKTAKNLKNAGVTIYTIGCFDDAEPDRNPEEPWLVGLFSNKLAFNRYMHAVSSNYPKAEKYDDLQGGGYTNGYYKKASTSGELNSIFAGIAADIGSTTVTLDENAVLKDVISDNFVLPAGFSASNVTVQSVDYAGNGTFNESTCKTLDDATVTISGNTVNVKGFDYAANYCIDGSGTVSTSGKKLRVIISGVEVNPDNFQSGAVATNDATSGIYDGDGEAALLVKAFNVPEVNLGSYSYVLDYAKSFTMNPSDWSVTELKHMSLLPTKFDRGNTESLKLTNGLLTGLNYTPKTTAWDGYDTFYGFGTYSDTEPYIWSKVNVIPANNVYYEDTFKDTTSDDANNGTVGIVYSGNVTVGTEGTNTETPNGSVMGWIDSMADDNTTSDGSETKLEIGTQSGATATFTFKGTGVDIYSRTDLESGLIIASLYVGDNAVAKKTMFVDTLAVSAGKDGSYYNIPTLSFSDLPYADDDGNPITYKVKLSVSSARAVELDEVGNPVTGEDGKLVYSATEKRKTYYLDGIRIYNPLGSTITDDTVIDAYDPSNDLGDGEKTPAESIQSVFTKVRDILDSGNVFIDVNDEGVIGATDYATSEVNTTYGPKNEVYLAPGQSIVFAIDNYDGTGKYYVGLKSITGESIEAAFTEADGGVKTTINHSTDLYYAVTPTSDGKITVKNNSNSGILSVTKLQALVTGDFAVATVSEDEAIAYATNFATFTLSNYQQPAVEEPETPAEPVTPTEPEQPTEAPTEPEQPTEPEIPDIDVDIDNPADEPEQKPNQSDMIQNLVKNLFNKIFGWFGR